jgi:ParB-like chromosome segregation protein Spo0J
MLRSPDTTRQVEPFDEEPTPPADLFVPLRNSEAHEPQWRLEFRDPAGLLNHHASIKIYGTETPVPDFVESIREYGILDPLRILPDGRLLSGHRRRQAAIIVGLATVPVLVYVGPEMSAEEQELQVIESNRQREKSAEQRAREYDRLVAVKSALAEQRQLQKLKKGRESSVPENFRNGETGEAKEQAAEAVGWSKHTAERAALVVHRIDEAEAEGDSETAAGLRDMLNNRTVAEAHRKATGMTKEPRGKTALDWDDSEFEDLMKAMVKFLADREKKFPGDYDTYYDTCREHISGLGLAFKELRRARR